MKRLCELYKTEVVFRFMEKFRCVSVMQVPNLRKITLNMGVGRASEDKKILQNATRDLSMITGQKPVPTIAKRSVSGFKIRKGQAIGCRVTLRRRRMWDFFERLLYVSIPRIRDFRGLSTASFDGRGNYNLGVREQVIFPEIKYDRIDEIRGLDIAITTNAGSDEKGYFLLRCFNFPFRRENLRTHV